MEQHNKNICRICMATDSNLISMFEKIGNKSYAQILSSCTKCKINNEDKLPKNICEKCSEEMLRLHYFKEKAENSQKEFIKLLSSNLSFAIESYEKCDKSTQTENNDDSKERYSTFITGNNYELKNCKNTEVAELNCPLCNRIFSRKDHIKEHIFNVHKEVPKKYFPKIEQCNLQCPICNRKFNRKHHVQRHVESVHKLDQKIVLKQAQQIAMKSTDETNEISAGVNKTEALFLEKNPISSDQEPELDFINLMVNSNSNTLIKDEPNYESECLKEEMDEKMTVEVELPEFMSYETEDYRQENNSLDEPHLNAQAADDKSTSSSENDSEPLIKIKNSIAQRRYGSGEGTPEERTCQLCQRIFSRLCHLRRHIKTVHTEERPYACPHCVKRFARSDRLKYHIEGVHAEKTHKCDMCGKAFSRKEALQRHKKIPHGSDASSISFNCELCERTFPQKRFLMRHQLLHSDRIFACRYCEETFKDRKLFIEHERSHKSSTKDFLCSMCGESFGRIDYLRIHVQRHLGEKPHKCQYCEKSFIRKSDLKEHERYHTNTKPNVCKICGKAFVRRSKLTIHMRIHTGEKPYTCDHCPKSFAQRNDLKAHVRRHTGERFRCDQCDAAFLQLYGLRQHALNAHGMVIESSTGRLEKVEVPLMSKN